MQPLDEFIRHIRQRNLLEKYRIPSIGIFGSFLKTREYADIDILIEEFIDFKDLIGLRSELESLSGGKSIDIVIKKYASPIIIHRARKDIIYVT